MSLSTHPAPTPPGPQKAPLCHQGGFYQPVLVGGLVSAGVKLEAAPGHVTQARHLITDALTPAQLKQFAKLARALVANLEASLHAD